MTHKESFTDIRVATLNPDALDEVVQQLPRTAAVVVDGSYDGTACTVRVLSGNPEFVRFAITNQGYGTLVPGGED